VAEKNRVIKPDPVLILMDNARKEFWNNGDQVKDFQKVLCI
jgi:hypothetical protein